MKLHILSDLHLEFGKWPKHVDINAIDADVTILAGDIGVGLQGLEWALSIDRPVIYVMGNHEFYGQRPMADLWRKAQEKVEHTHVHLLENESVQIGNVRFVGCTLWTDFAVFGMEHQEEMMRYAAHVMSDFTSIYVNPRGKSSVGYGLAGKHGGDRLTPRKVLSLHHDSRDFLEQGLARMPRNVGESDIPVISSFHVSPHGKVNVVCIDSALYHSAKRFLNPVWTQESGSPKMVACPKAED